MLLRDRNCAHSPADFLNQEQFGWLSFPFLPDLLGFHKQRRLSPLSNSRSISLNGMSLKLAATSREEQKMDKNADLHIVRFRGSFLGGGHA
jgi:hypothetical protein